MLTSVAGDASFPANGLTFIALFFFNLAGQDSANKKNEDNHNLFVAARRHMHSCPVDHSFVFHLVGVFAFAGRTI